MGDIIGSLRVAPDRVRPWEPVRVEVLDPAGALPDGDVQVWIDHVPGAAQWLQLPAGEHHIAVHARHGDISEVTTTSVTVTGEPLLHVNPEGAKRPAVLCAHAGTGRPYEITIVLSTPPPPRRASGQEDPRRRPDPEEPTRGGEPSRLRVGRAVRDRVLRRAPQREQRARRGTRGRVRGNGATRVPQSTYRFELHTDPALQLDDPLRRQIEDARRATTTTGTVYTWQLGDGTTARTDVPTIVHDYTGRFDLRRPAASFDVRCRVERAGDEPFVVARTLVLDSWYAACRAQGRIVCPVESVAIAPLHGGAAEGRFVVFNPEDQPISFDQMALASLRSEDRGERVEVKRLAEPVVVPPGTSTAMVVLPDLHDLDDDALGFSVILAGAAADSTPARATAVVELPLGGRTDRSPLFSAPAEQRHTWPWEEVTGRLHHGLGDRGRATPVVLEATEKGTVHVDREVGLLAVSPAQGRDVRLVAGLRGHLDALLDEAVDQLTATPRKGTFPKTDPVAENGRCDPDNIPAADAATADAASLACQLAEQEEVRVSGRFLNARKGDIVLSAAGVTPMARLYQEMQPPQAHSHAGIMTRNFDEIAHCFGSSEWLESRLRRVAPSGAPDPDLQAIRFGWPGAVLQHTEDSVRGEPFLDPDGNTFNISGIQPYDIVAGSLRVTPPLVVKPDPLLETPALRATLQATADDAVSVAGRAGGIQSGVHFSFFTFTNGAFAALAPPTADGAFPSGTLPGACSTFIWRLLRARGVVFEQGNLAPGILQTGDLEPNDLGVTPFGGQAKVVPGGIDGLYLYDAGERIKAASALKERMVHEINESHWGPDFLTDLPAGAVVDLFLNVIAFNSIEPGERWRDEPTVGVTVSPDDMLFWDGPATGGSYGFAEPLLYREPRTEVVDVYRWARYERTYRVSGTVLLDGAPVRRADVTCGTAQGFTDAQGRYELTGVPEGKARVKARASLGSVNAAGESEPLVIHGDRVVDVVLQRPTDAARRQASIVMNFFGIDDESGDDDLHSDSGLRTVKLNPDDPSKVLPAAGDPFLTFKWGGECRAEYRVTLSLLVDLSIRVDVHGEFFEGTYEGTTELERTFDGHIFVPKDTVGDAFVLLTNEGGDRARLDLQVFNDIEPVQ